MEKPSTASLLWGGGAQSKVGQALRGLQGVCHRALDARSKEKIADNRFAISAMTRESEAEKRVCHRVLDTRSKGFTLAEVLITLGIIGVVAAMTLPTLLSNVQEKVLEGQVKKAANIAANGYKLMLAHYEAFNVANLPFMSTCQDLECVSREHKEVFNVTKDSTGGLTADVLPAEYAIKGETQPSPFHWSDVPYIFMTGDGFVYGVTPNDAFTSFDVIVDVNGKQNPNIAVRDLRKYRFSGEGGQLFDVSEELAQVSQCRPDNPSGCTTRQECESIIDWDSPDYDCNQSPVWRGDACIIGNNCPQ